MSDAPLKRNPETRHIPVHVISADEEDRLGLSIGAYGYSGKPVERDAILATFDEVKSFGKRSKRLLAIEPASPSGSLANLFGEDDVEVQSAATLEEAEQAILDNGFDCVVLDLSTPADGSLHDLVSALVATAEPLVILLLSIRRPARSNRPARIA